MEIVTCKNCGVTKPMTNYYVGARTCPDCCNNRSNNYERDGLNMAEELQTSRLKGFIRDTKLFLKCLNYDVDKNIHEQFKARIYEKYGVKFD